MEYLTSLKHKIITNNINPGALEVLDALKDEFTVVSMQKKLDEIYLSSKDSDEVLGYAIGQVQSYEDHFDQLWSGHYRPLLDDLKKKYKTEITQELNLLLQSIIKLQNFFKTYHKKQLGPAPLEIFDIVDAKGSALIFNQSMQIEELSQDKKKKRATSNLWSSPVCTL